MFNRRKFLQSSLFSAAGAVIRRRLPEGDFVPRKPTLNEPIVVSTWSFGKAANTEAWKTLSSGGRALDAVEAGARIPEADLNNHSVGRAGYPDRDGHVTLDACIMDEHAGCGAVMAIEHIAHPISVARLVMEKTPHVVLVGEGALQFALANGFKKEELLTPESEKAWKEWLKKEKYKPVINIEEKSYGNKDTSANIPVGPDNHDTIGIVAMDDKGNLSGACTTSGMAFKMRGRVGDSPIIGAGLFVDNEFGAATSTGLGEEVIRIVGSHLVVEYMRQGLSPEDACKKTVERIIRRNPEKRDDLQVGFLALNKSGQFGAFAIQPGFVYSVKSNREEKVYTSPSWFD